MNQPPEGTVCDLIEMVENTQEISISAILNWIDFSLTFYAILDFNYDLQYAC